MEVLVVVVVVVVGTSNFYQLPFTMKTCSGREGRWRGNWVNIGYGWQW